MSFFIVSDLHNNSLIYVKMNGNDLNVEWFRCHQNSRNSTKKRCHHSMKPTTTIIMDQLRLLLDLIILHLDLNRNICSNCKRRSQKKFWAQNWAKMKCMNCRYEFFSMRISAILDLLEDYNIISWTNWSDVPHSNWLRKRRRTFLITLERKKKKKSR